MSTHIRIELINVFAEDTEDLGYQPDEFFIKGKILTTEPGNSPIEFETDYISISSNKLPKEFGVVDKKLFNDQVAINATLAIQMRAIEEVDSVANTASAGPFTFGEDRVILGDYNDEFKVSDLPLGEKIITIEDFQHDDFCYQTWFGCLTVPNSGWDYTVNYKIVKWENDDLIGGPGQDTFFLGDDYLGGGDYDYAVIKDFDIENDVIQLHGNISDYELENTNLGVNIYYSSGDNQDLIGFVEDVYDSELSFGNNLEVDYFL